MDRRAFVSGVAGGLLDARLAAEAQQAAKPCRVGFILSVSPVSVSPVSELTGAEPTHPAARGFLQEMRSLGYVTGQDLIMEWRSAEGRPERHGDILRDFVRMNVDAIVTANDPVALEARRITSTIPIVLGISTDPVASGLAASLAQPAGNVTGLTATPGPEMAGKHVQFLKEAAPKASRVVFLVARKPGWEGGQCLPGSLHA